jgi:peptidoglycan/LPS O-acetylase OafA/YrhL
LNFDRISRTEYRPDIDGLRALAVLSVVAFHIDPDLLPGGFVGVDIFFVISGYLISRQIMVASKLGDFSFADFYVRRARRLAPALLVVIAAVLLVSQFVLTPAHLLETARSAMAGALSAANAFFVYGVDTGYFAPDSSTKPLLHLWSLGVEVQFYLVWPVILFALCAMVNSNARLLVIAVLTIGGVALSQWQVQQNPVFAYYMLPSRSFELLLGALAAAILLRPDFHFGRFGRNAVGGAGVVLIFCSLATLTGEASFPGLNAIAPTLGAAMIIIANGEGQSLVGRILAWKPAVLIGLMSYSLYLWHWPILAFMRYSYIGASTPSIIGAVGLMILLSWLSYRYVELPCRKMRSGRIDTVWVQFLFPSLAVGLACVAIVKTDGFGAFAFSQNYRNAVTAANKLPLPAYKYDHVCQVRRVRAAELTNPKCVINADDAPPKMLLWGDSHAAHYIGVVGALAKANGFSFRNIAHSACPSLLFDGSRFAAARSQSACGTSQQSVSVALKDYSTVVMSSQWSAYARSPDFFGAVRATAIELRRQGKAVFILGEVPSFPNFSSDCFVRTIKLSFVDCNALSSHPFHNHDETNRKLKEIAESVEGVTYLDVTDVICPNGACRAAHKNAPLYFDTTHLSLRGSEHVGRRLLHSAAAAEWTELR